ncbi:MAG: hypothetical protein CVU11_13290 [Bacteroidetes bacterium HGW-Bacteroidetes-6]|jgi:hypothetical protein|nr:MAG: hypothetical protein CVU11_13290 [Bacteroidetes bacterium HGW-Bacteroidetes-6]
MSGLPFTMSDFDKKSSGVGVEDKHHDAMMKRFIQRHNKALNNVQELCGKLPEHSEFFALWTLKSFNAFTFIQYFIAERGKIDELTITTYNMSRLVIGALMRLVDTGKIDKLTVFLSDAAKSLFPASYKMVQEESVMRSDKVSFHYAWNHSKVALAKIADDYFVLEGSGNFSENSRHEQYILTNNSELYEFRKNWIIDSIK